MNGSNSVNVFKRIQHYMSPTVLKENKKRLTLWVFWIIFNIGLYFIPNSVTQDSIVLLLPVAGLFLYAIVSQQVYEAMFLGTVSMYILWYKGNALSAFVDCTRETLTSTDTITVVIGFFLCGGVINALTKSGVTKAFSDWVVSKVGGDEKLVLASAGIFTAAMSVDDYVASLICGSAFSPLMDAMKKPRVALSYIVRACSTCCSNLLPFGAWGVFSIYQFANASTVENLDEARGIFMSTIPYQVFPILACVTAFLLAAGLLPKIGSMKKAYQMAEEGVQMGAVAAADGEDETKAINEMIAADPRKQGVSVINLVLPIAAMIFFLFVWDFDTVKAYSSAMLATGILYITQGMFTLTEFVDVVIEGAANMFDMVVLLVLGYSIQSVLATMGFENFILGVCNLVPIASLIPAVFFVYFAFEEYLFSLNYTLYQILFPALVVVLPLTGANVPLTLGAVMSAVLFGANACVVSDCGVIAAKAVGVKIYDQYTAHLPYTLMTGAVTALIYLVLGFVL